MGCETERHHSRFPGTGMALTHAAGAATAGRIGHASYDHRPTPLVLCFLFA